MKRRIKATLILLAGICLLLIGLAGLVLPILPGLLFAAMGLILISLYSPKLRAWMDARTERFPKLHAFVVKMRAWLGERGVE